MTTVALIILLVLLGALAVFQLALAAGAPLGRYAWAGQHDGALPARLRIGSAVSIVIYALIAVVALERAGVIDLIPGEVVETVAMWVIAVYFALGIVMNGISRSKPERYTMTPVVIVLTAASVILALS
ncbi:MAG: hypothetical protein RIA38_05240 [Microcella pacifica]|uniref:hypothetical protein n=1 Tax=Microcella pacifica TaxID=2591847 RepID=UPI00331572E0